MDLGSTNKTYINVSDELHSCLLASLSLVNLIVCNGFDFFSFLFILQEKPVEPQRYYELLEKDTIKFGNSRYAREDR